MRLFNWLFNIKPEPKVPEIPIEYIGMVRKSPLHAPYITVSIVGQCFFMKLHNPGIYVKLDRKCLPQLIPLLEQVKLDENDL